MVRAGPSTHWRSGLQRAPSVMGVMLAVQASSRVAEYVPLLPYLVFVLGMVGVLLTVPHLLAKKSSSAAKSSPYECGLPAQGSARRRISIHFYLVAVLFILFDIEAVFLFPWAVALQQLGPVGFSGAVVFVAVLGLGLAYAWRKGVLDWK